TDRRQALQAIESLHAGAGGSDLGVALQLASAIARRQADAETVVLSDGNGELPGRLAVQGKLTYLPLGIENANQAVGNLRLEPAPGGQSLTAFVQAINYGSQPAARRLAVFADEQLVDAFDLQLAAGETQAVLAQGLLTTTRVVEARLVEPGALPPAGPAEGAAAHAPAAEAAAADAPGAPATSADFLALDDRAWAVNRPARSVAVTLTGPGNLFLETGLSLLPRLQVTRLASGTALPPADLTILDGGLPLTGTLPSGALLFINPLQSTAFFSVTGGLSNPRPQPASENEPLLEYVALEQVNLLDAARIPLPEWAHAVIVAQGPDGDAWPLLFTGEVQGRRVAVLAFDLRRSDLPLQVAFPLLLANLADWLAPGQAGGELPAQISPGQALQIPPPDGAAQVTVTRPDGARATLQAAGGPLLFADTAQLGVYRVQTGEGELLAAANLFAPRESQLEPLQELPVTGLEADNAAAAGQPAWSEQQRWLMTLALGLLVGEWLVYHRPTLLMIIEKLRRRAA
ncbi:MAG: hypothetical protein ACKOC5_10365, partial [Chloroflexota bacterium]